MAETALNFGPDWIRAYSAGAANIANPPATMPIPKYSLAEFRYGREEMLALIPKDVKLPPCLKEFPHLVHDQFQMPLALIPVTEDEQRLWTTSINSDAALRASGKSVPGMGRTGRGGSVDRGRGRGRGGYYQRGLIHDDPEDGLHGFSRPKPVERSLSANERDLRWDDRDRRYDRPYSCRGSAIDDGFSKQDNLRGQHDYWRKYDKDDEGDWRTSGSRSSDRPGGRGSWRSSSDKDRRDMSDRDRRDMSDRDRRDIPGRDRRDLLDRDRGDISERDRRDIIEKERRDLSDRDRRDLSDRNPHNRNTSTHNRSGTNSHKNHSWKDSQGNNLPEWSVEETSETDTVGTFDSSGAFLETKTSNSTSLDEIYISDDADEGLPKDSPEAEKEISKKMPKKILNSATKKSGRKKAYSNSKAECLKENITEDTSETVRSNSEISKTVVTKSTNNVIKTDSNVMKKIDIKKSREKDTEFIAVLQSNVPIVNSKTAKVDEIVLNNLRTSENTTPTNGTAEEDAFAHHKKATENMVAQWTEEEEQVISHTADNHSPHEKDVKWFYQDPQGDIQGPFASAEMLEWFSAGYFTVNLKVRRSCDDTYSELGDLIKTWGRVPFMPGSHPPPIRATSLASSLTIPITQTSVPIPASASASSQLPKQDDLLALQQRFLQQQLLQQQYIIRQAQIQAILAQLKTHDSFTSLSSQQQQQVLMHHVITQQQVPRPNINPLGEQSSILDPVAAPLPMPLLGLTMPPVINDMSLWNTPSSGTWPLNLNTSQPPGTSIWDVDLIKSSSEESEIEKQKKLAEEQKARKTEELRLEQLREAEEKRIQEELRLQELQKQEEEKRRLEEIKRLQEEEKKRQDEIRRLEEQRRQEEELKKQEELRRQEELQKQEELRKQEELKKIEELKRREEQKRREELRKQEQRQLEELQKKEELRKQEEIRKQQERKLEEKRRKEEQLKEEKRRQCEREQEKMLELERQKEALRQKEIEREEKFQAEKREREELDLMKLSELKLRSQGPVWGIRNAQSNTELSLADIQRIQEEKEREEREEKLRQQALQQQTVKQVQQNKNGLSWAKRATDGQPVVKSLIEIQQEEAERLAFMQRTQKPQPPPPSLNSNTGVWGNSSHLNKIAAPPQTWNLNSVSSTGFWDDVISSSAQSRKQPQKANESSAFPALANRVQPATVNNNKNKNVRAKKEEDVVTRLFGSHLKPTDEFTKWCTDALSSMPSSVDVPTFVAFLKDIESPYEVYDYVKSYLGEGKEPREFAKQFLEKRSKFRNQAKQAPAEDNTLWGPAPAITPSVNKPVVPSNECDGNSNAKGKTKRRKNRMQKLDNSMLGFTVQSNPDRLNVGEIDHIDGM